MKAWAKLGYVHRRLWQRDGTYRIATILGPPPLLGCAAAALAWGVMHVADARHGAGNVPPPWAAMPDNRVLAAAGPPRVLRPFAPLPPMGPDGKPKGLVPGWDGALYGVDVGPVLDPMVRTVPVGPLRQDKPGLDMDVILTAGLPPDAYVQVAVGMLLIRTAGVYGLSMQAERPASLPADCLTSLSIEFQMMVSTTVVGLAWPRVAQEVTGDLRLEPGVYRVGAFFGCWRNQVASGPASATVVIRHPGETDFRPVTSEEIMRPVRLP